MLENWLKLFRSPEGKLIHYVRASTLGHYWYCAVQAWLQATRGIEPPASEALQIGKRIHDQITKSRKPSRWEQQFQDFITQFMVDRNAGEGSTGLATEGSKVFMRPWYDGETIVGHVVTHGVDDFRVYPDRTVILVEYKTTAQRVIDYYKLAPAVFQLKVYMWILEPYLKLGGYKLLRGEVVFLTRRGKPLGVKQIVDYDSKEVEQQLARIFYQFNHPESLVPPARWKCLNCPQVYKKECPFIEKKKGNLQAGAS